MKKTTLCWSAVLIATLLTCPSAPGAEQKRPPDSGNGPGGKPPAQRQGRNNGIITGSAVKTFSGSSLSKNLTHLAEQSSKSNESALRVQDGANVFIERLNVQKTGNASSEEDSNFYSLNAAVAVWKNSFLAINGGQVATSGEGANAFVAYGTNAVLKVFNLEIATTKNSSRGLHATYGGRIEGENLKITTQGAHCAALATDRGGGTVTVRDVQAETHGDGSPGIYSTGNISAADSTFEAFGAEAAVIEGKNTISVRNCTMLGHRRCGAMLYQSFSGDAQTGTCVFTMDGGSLTAKRGPVFYVTNTSAQVSVTQAELVSGNGVLIEAGSNRWGRNGSNGGHLKFHAQSQKLQGDVVVNDVSDVTLVLGSDTQLAGALNAKATAGKVNLELGDGAVWSVTADSSVDNLTSAGGTLNDLRSKIASNGHVIHYRTKQGFLDGSQIALDHGGMLVYTPAPKVSVQASSDNANGQKDNRGNRNGHRPPPPPDGFGGGHGGPPPDEKF